MAFGRETDRMDTEQNDLEERAFLQAAPKEKALHIVSEPEPAVYIKALEELIRHMPLIAFVRPVRESGPVKVMSEKISALGYTARDFTSGELTYEEIIDPQDVPGVMLELLENAREGAYELMQRYRVRTKKGEIRLVKEHTLIQRDESGKPAYYLSLLTILDTPV
jgi:PAS domain-containing protein